MFLSLFFNFTYGQISVSNDTLICDSSPVLLYADITGSMGTSNYSFSFIPFTPETYTGNVVILADDAVSGILPIGFDFCFLGNTYNEFYFGSNGWISFPGANNAITYTSAVIPSTDPSVPKNCIMGPWEDWHPGLCASPCLFYQTIGTAPNRKLVCTWLNVPMYQCTTTYGTFQIVIHETTNIIDNFLENKPSCPTWANGTGTQGVHDMTGTISYTVPGRNSTQWQAQNEGIRFEPSGVEWYSNGVQVGYGDSLTVTPTETSIYEAVVSLCDGTSYSDSVTIFVGSQASITEIDETCFNNNDGEIIVDIPDGNWSVEWTDATGNIIQSYSTTVATIDTLSSLSASAYHVTMFDSVSGCSVFDTAYINQPPPIDYFDTIADAYCNQAIGEISVMAFGGVGTGLVTYMWDDGSSSGTITNLIPGNYSLTMYDEDGCDTTITYTINNIEILDAQINNPFLPNILVGDQILLTENSTDATQIDTYDWYVDTDPSLNILDTLFYSGQTPPDIIFTDGGDFSVVLCVIDIETNCEDCDTLRFTIISESSIEVPNVFSPDGDGKNDYFNVITAGDASANLLNFIGTIYNRWGKKIYEWTDWANVSSGWDGSMQGGTKAPDGTYFVVIKAQAVDDSPIKYSGHLNLFRNN